MVSASPGTASSVVIGRDCNRYSVPSRSRTYSSPSASPDISASASPATAATRMRLRSPVAGSAEKAAPAALGRTAAAR